jgi:uncharacterized protein YkwD
MQNDDPTRADAPMPKARKLVSLAAIAMAAFALFPAVSAAAACPNADTQPAQISPLDYQASVLCLLNDERGANGLVALTSQAQLMQAAAEHSGDMLRLSYFSHTDPDGTTFSQRITDTGYLRGAKRWVVGENLAWGTAAIGTPRALVDGWMESPPHRENVLEPRFRDVGIGAVSGRPDYPSASNAMILTADFGLARGRAARSRLRRTPGK